MNIQSYIYRMRKRIPDETLLKLQHIINEEVSRRAENDIQQKGQRH